MNLQQLTLKVQQLTQQLQQTQDLAKKISELPLQSILDPASLLHVSRNGISEKLTVQKIIESASSLAFNRLLYVGDFILDGNTFTVPELAQWLIENVIFQNASAVTFNVPFSASARIRRDVVFGNNQGQILRQVGLEISNDGIEPPKPAIPPNTVEITSFTVTDSVIGLPDAPIIGVDAITKLSQGWLVRPFSGSNVRLTASDPSKSYALTNDDLVSIEGIATTGFSNEFEWDGQEIVLFRDSNTPFTILHGIEDFGLMPFIFTSGVDFVMDPYSLAKFKRRDNKIYLISYSVFESNTTPLLDAVLQASLNNTTERIIQNIPSNTDYGFESNRGYFSNVEFGEYALYTNRGDIRTNGGTVRASQGYFEGPLACQKITFSFNSPAFSNGLAFVGSTEANKLLYYGNAEGTPVITSFVGRQIPDANWVNSGLVLKANLTGGNNYTGPQTVAGQISSENSSTDNRVNIQTGGPHANIQSANYGDNVGKGLALNAFGPGGVSINKFYPEEALDVNGNIKLSGLNYLGRYTTGTEPTPSTPGATLFNTSLNKMRVFGATAWETITSV